MSDAEDRILLREHGHLVPSRGRLSPELRAAARELREPMPGDYDEGVTEADFGEEPEPAAEPEETLPVVPAERKPRKLSGGRAWNLRAKGGKDKPKARPKHKRIPVDRFCEHAWELLARIAAPASPPVSRCLSMQAPVAGLILEDVVRDTVVDRVLQPVARAEEKGRKVLALVGPPVIVAALEHAQGLPDDQRMMREAVLVPLLKESMLVWIDIAGEKVAEKARRDEEEGPVRQQVEELLAMIFAPEPGTADEAAEREPAGV